ncbi:extracellular solute-binding protein [Kineococcus sp. SYSU DK004]|uniref:extracellular solute-binding protein n=1 Tax=Kineococcus sp. SYSU DK004 TaxID=3383125 RepID=UPI003D7E64A3
MTPNPTPGALRATSRRSLLAAVFAAPLAATALSACGGSSGPGQTGGEGGGGAGGGATIWYLTGDPKESIRDAYVEAFNESSDGPDLTPTAFQNDAYKTKIRTAVGAGQAPTIIYGWGGGGMRDFARAGQIEPLTAWLDENPQVRDRLLESTWAAATVDGEVYAMPNETVQPIVFFYNKRLFEQVGAQPPQTWDDLIGLVGTFKDAGIAPISLAGQSRWTTMMWLEFLFDRVGGPELFQSIYDGQPEAWSNPDSLRALTMAQDLVRAGGFVDGFNSIVADQNADQALLYTDRAAMMLHGTWTYGAMKADGGDFVTGGNLGYANFPTVTGGKGDPGNSLGNPAQYFYLSATASEEDKEVARTFFAEGLMTDEVIDAFITEAGEVPVVTGIEDRFSLSDDQEWMQFVYDVVSEAPSFQQSWDQALSPEAAEELLTNIEQLFQLAITPEQFAANMNAVLDS